MQQYSFERRIVSVQTYGRVIAVRSVANWPSKSGASARVGPQSILTKPLVINKHTYGEQTDKLKLDSSVHLDVSSTLGTVPRRS